MNMKVSSTLGYEREHQPLLAIADEDEFVDVTTSALGPQPPNFKNIVALNRGPLRRDDIEGHPLAPRQLDQLQGDGAMVVDIRTDQQFDDAHVPGSVCITALRAGFGSKLAWLADPAQPIAIVGRDDDDGDRAVALAAAVGITNVAGYLAGGMTSWREEQRPVTRTARMTVPELHARWERGGEVQILDVRELAEWEAGHIPGSHHVPYHDIRALPPGLDPDRPIAVICGSGQRAAVGASLLDRYGAAVVIHVVDGGVGTWKRAGWAIEQATRRPRGQAG
jgi:rhodanese-related sulfurtransferase